MDHLSGRVRPALPLSTRESHPFHAQSDSVFDTTQGWAGALPLPLRPRRLAGFSAEYCLRRETDTRPQQFPPGLSLSSEGSRQLTISSSVRRISRPQRMPCNKRSTETWMNEVAFQGSTLIKIVVACCHLQQDALR
jgi:hypothetical protein